jgi:hypothetical protein
MKSKSRIVAHAESNVLAVHSQLFHLQETRSEDKDELLCAKKL